MNTTQERLKEINDTLKKINNTLKSEKPNKILIHKVIERMMMLEEHNLSDHQRWAELLYWLQNKKDPLPPDYEFRTDNKILK